MSLNLVRNNSSSPFRLQRSMVDQGGEGGAYESGGYTGQSEYSDGGISEAIASIGKVVGAGLSSRTAGDKNKSNEKKAERLEIRAKKTETKKQNAIKSGDINKSDRMQKRGERVEGKLKQTTADIKKYNESQKPTAKSDIAPVKDEAKAIPSASTEKIEVDRAKTVMTNAYDAVDIVNPNKKTNRYNETETA